MKILITLNYLLPYREQIEKYDAQFIWKTNEDATKEDVEDADVIIGNIDLKLLDEAKNLKYLHYAMAGSDAVAAHKTIKDKVLLTNSTGCFSLSIAEWMIGMVLYFYKNLNVYIPQQQQHIFMRNGETRSIYDSKILIIGYGDIGSNFAKRMKTLGAHITGIKRTVAEKPEELDALYTIDHLDECLKDADIVAMCLPQSNETRNLMNRERLSLLKEGSLLINVGRGTAIDTEALIDILKEKKIQAALDVFEREPLEKDSPLWDMENVLITPHSTGTGSLAYTRKRLAELALYNLDAYLNQKPLKNVVDHSTGYKVSNT